MNKRRAAVIASIVLAVMLLLYLGGVLGQVLTNYEVWMATGGFGGQVLMEPPGWNPLQVYPAAFTWNGLESLTSVKRRQGKIHEIQPALRW